MHLKPEIELGSNPTRVVLIRHGQSTSNAEGKCQGRCDQAVLTEKGRNSARQTGAVLQGLTFDAVYTSPMKRARQTASEVLASISTTVNRLPIFQVADQLQEIDLPAWQGLTHKYIREQFAEDYRCWKQRPHQFQMLPQASGLAQTGGLAVASPVKQQCFPVLDLYKQAQQFWQEILPRHPGKTVLVVGHAGTHRALISTAIGLTPDRYHVLQQSNCGISILNFHDGCSQPAQLDVLNLTTHLGEFLPKLKEGKQGLRLILVRSGATDLQQIQKLAEFLKSVPLDFCLSSPLANSEETAEQILQSQPRPTLHLQVLREDFPLVWQQAISTPRAVATTGGDPTCPITGLVVADEAMTKSMLSQVLGMKSDQFWRLKVDPGALSIIHYPSADSSPVLQAMNIASTKSLISE